MVLMEPRLIRKQIFYIVYYQKGRLAMEEHIRLFVGNCTNEKHSCSGGIKKSVAEIPTFPMKDIDIHCIWLP